MFGRLYSNAGHVSTLALTICSSIPSMNGFVNCPCHWVSTVTFLAVSSLFIKYAITLKKVYCPDIRRQRVAVELLVLIVHCLAYFSLLVLHRL